MLQSDWKRTSCAKEGITQLWLLNMKLQAADYFYFSIKPESRRGDQGCQATAGDRKKLPCVTVKSYWTSPCFIHFGFFKIRADLNTLKHRGFRQISIQMPCAPRFEESWGLVSRVPFAQGPFNSLATPPPPHTRRPVHKEVRGYDQLSSITWAEARSTTMKSLGDKRNNCASLSSCHCRVLNWINSKQTIAGRPKVLKRRKWWSA